MKQPLASYPKLPVPALIPWVEPVRPVVLVVDDDEFQRRQMGKILESVSCHLFFATNGAEALETVCLHWPDLILMDILMPQINGLETLRKLKSMIQFASIPVMMMTGHCDKNVVAESFKNGAAGFMVKPLNRDVVLKNVTRILAGQWAL